MKQFLHKNYVNQLDLQNKSWSVFGEQKKTVWVYDLKTWDSLQEGADSLRIAEIVFSFLSSDSKKSHFLAHNLEKIRINLTT